METNFNFKSQICTDKNQSERLLALGLKKETADMCSVIDHVSDSGKWEEVDTIFSFTPDDWEDFGRHVTPRWSLHRLLSLIPKEFEANVVPMYGRNYRKWVCFNMNFDYNIIYFDGNQEDFVGFYEGDIYDKIISCIEWLIKEGYFNKEYLV